VTFSHVRFLLCLYPGSVPISLRPFGPSQRWSFARANRVWFPPALSPAMFVFTGLAVPLVSSHHGQFKRGLFSSSCACTSRVPSHSTPDRCRPIFLWDRRRIFFFLHRFLLLPRQGPGESLFIFLVSAQSSDVASPQIRTWLCSLPSFSSSFSLTGPFSFRGVELC